MSSPNANANAAANAAADDIDIGILANQQPNADDNGNDNHDEPAATSRWNVYESISYGTDFCGNCCYSDIADGSTTSPALPSIIGLRISGVGDVPLPLSNEHADKIKSKATKKKKVFEFEADKIKTMHPQWNASLEKLLETVAYKLGVNPHFLSAELDKLMYMEKGGYIERRSDDEDALGSLIIQLPSKFTGGEMTVYNVALEGEEGADNNASKFTLGAGKEATYSCHFACHFSDCEYELAKLKSGSRLLLRYSLFYEQVDEIPTASRIIQKTSLLTWSLSGLSPVDRIVVVPLKDQYRPQSLANAGVNVLSRKHRQKAEAIKAAGKGWKLLIVNAKTVHTHHYGGSCSDDSSIIAIFDESGEDVTSEMSWLKNVVHFDEFVEENDAGMILAVEDDYNECVCTACWGECKSRIGGGEYTDCHSTYRATFLVGYDPSFETEVKCLGGCEGVAEVCQTIVDTRDYTLLDRLMVVVEAKERSKFNSHSCEILLRMLTKSRKDPLTRVTLANKIITGLSSSEEPDELLYDAILEVVVKCGHEELRESIEELLREEARKSSNDISIFLRRMDFGLKLSERVEEGGPNYLEGAINDLSRHGNTGNVLNSTAVVNTIMDMIAIYAESDLSNVVEACLNFLHRVTIRHHSLPLLMNRTLLLEKLLATGKFGSLQPSLVEFAADFVKGIGKISIHNSKRQLEGEGKAQFVQAAAFVINYGTQHDCDKFGKWAITSMYLFSAFIDAITSVKGEGLLCDILNKCLLQYSIVSPDAISNWTVRTPNEPNILPTPSLHVKKVLELYPNIVQMVDKDNRLPLHYATTSNTVSFEVITEVFEASKQAASIREPISGLFPFQLAASIGNHKASFSLLLANPSLVSTGIKDNDRKRKRNTSSP